MLYLIVSFLGCILGYFTAKFTKEELKKGAVYFRLIQIIILILLIYYFIPMNFRLYLFLFGVLIGVIFRFEYFYFGFIASSFYNIIISSLLIFLYGLPYGTLIYYLKKPKYLIYSLILFSIAFFTYIFNYDLLSFGVGGLVGIFLIKLIKFYEEYLR